MNDIVSKQTKHMGFPFNSMNRYSAFHCCTAHGRGALSLFLAHGEGPRPRDSLHSKRPLTVNALITMTKKKKKTDPPVGQVCLR